MSLIFILKFSVVKTLRKRLHIKGPKGQIVC